MTPTISRCTASLGADVADVQLATCDDDELDVLWSALLEHKVLFFRDQEMAPEQHVDFGRRWGELEVHPTLQHLAGFPEIAVIESTAERKFSASKWHSDVTFREAPSYGAILRACVLPEAGGDTLWADTSAAYERLTDEWKQRLDGLVAVHDLAAIGMGRRREKASGKQLTARHPVIRRHPMTGAPCVFTNPVFTTRVDGVSRKKSDEILLHLERAVADPSVQVRFRWQPGSIAIWDNWSTQHFATDDFWPGHRRMERVNILTLHKA